MTADAQPEQANGQGPPYLDSSSAEKANRKQVAPILCVVPGCTVDVSTGPHYLKRHKICQMHLKAREVSIEGRAVRFCQQCGRFQPLADFKDNQRSCEAALAAHNARRRVKKDVHGNTWSSERRGRGSKRALAAASSSEDDAVGVPRKSAAPRKSSSQRSAPSNLQQSAPGSDSYKGSEGDDRPLSDGARPEQNAWTSHASPGNSYGSPEGMEQQQSQGMQLPGLQHKSSLCAGPSNSGSPAGADLKDTHQLHVLQPQMLPDGSLQQPGALSNSGASCGSLLTGRSRLCMQFCTNGSTDMGQPASCSAFVGVMQQLPQDLNMGSMQQMMSGPSLSCNPSFGGNFGQAGTLEAWMMPQSIMQQQQAQLQQFGSLSGTPLGLDEAMGQSMMLQQAMQEQQQLMMSQPQLHQQPDMHMQMQPNRRISHLQQPGLLQFKQEQQQQQVSAAMGTVKGRKVSGTDSSGTHVAVQDLSSNTGPAEPWATTGPQPPAPAAVNRAHVLPITSADAAVALAKDPLLGLLPLHGVNSSSSLSLIDRLEASAAPSAPAAAGEAGSGTNQFDEDALLDQALEVLLASGPDWQMDDVFLGPQAAALHSGTNSAVAPPATSSPSSSNINSINNLSGPLSVPSLPSGTTSAGQPAGLPLSAQQAACGMAATAAGLIDATHALRVGSPGKGPSTMLPPAQVQGGMLAAAGGGLGMPSALDNSLLPGALNAGTAGAWHPATAAGVMPGMDPSMAVSAAGGGMVPTAARGGTGGGGMLPAVAGSMQMGGMGHAGGMFQETFGGGACARGAPGGMAGFGTGMQPSAGGTMPCGMSAAPVLNGMSINAGGTSVGGTAADPMVHVTNGMAMQHSVAGGFSQLDHSFACPAMPSLQAMWQQQQQQQDGLLLQQQLLMQQQQQAEYLLLQQQQQMQRRQHLMQLQQQINSTMTYSQQLVRLSIKLHGVTPDQLPSSTVLAMERLLVNNAADIEMILLQPSLRQGCIQFELDVLVKCPQLQRPSDASATLPPLRTASSGCAAAERAADAADLDDFDPGRGSKTQLHMGSRMPAIVAALNSDPATEVAQARLRAALPFEQLVEALLDLPLLNDADTAASDASTAASDCHPDSSDDGSSDSSSDSSSDAGSSGSVSSSTVRTRVQAIYAQVGNSLGIWRADTGLVQDWDTELSPALSFGAGPVGSNWRPAITLCMPLVGAVAESSAASSPTAAAAGGAHLLKPLPLRLRLELQAAAAVGGSAANRLQLWCTRRGQFLPVATRTALVGGNTLVVDVQAVAGLLDSLPGLLLLQVDQQVQLQGAGLASTAAEELGCMSSPFPVLLCPSAAMAAECNVHLTMMDDSAHVVPKMQELGLVLDFWAMHQQVQQQQLTDSPHAQWQAALLNNRQYLQVIKSLGTRLLLTAVISGMSATSAHLHAIMSVLRQLLGAAPDHERAAPAGAAPVAAAAPAAATGGPAAAAHASTPVLDAQGGDAAVAAEARTGAQSSSSDHAQGVGSSAAAAAGLTPVQKWVFEDVDCKVLSKSDCHAPVGSSSSPDSGNDVSALTKPAGKFAHGAAGTVAGAAVDSDGQQSPYMVFRGATQMLVMLMVMYLLLEVVAAVCKGRSPAQQLLMSLIQLKDLLGIMLVPLAMMCLGGVLAVWQFGLSGSSQQHGQQQRHQQQANSLRRDAAGSKATGKAASLTVAAGVA